MIVKFDIPSDRIAHLFSTAITSSDPVKNSWLHGVWWNGKGAKQPSVSGQEWYMLSHFFDVPFRIAVYEQYDQKRPKKHTLDNAAVAKGLAVMATKYGHIFEQITGDNIDAPCADIFLQCCLFGREKYA